MQHLLEIEGLVENEIRSRLEHVANRLSSADHAKQNWPPFSRRHAGHLDYLDRVRQVEINNERGMIARGQSLHGFRGRWRDLVFDS